MASPASSPPTSVPSSPRKGFFNLASLGKKLPSAEGSASGASTPGGHITNIAQTPILESSNPLDKLSVPSEAREQQIVGVPGAKLDDGIAKILIALDGTEAGDKAFKYLLENRILKTDSHVFLCTVLPANVISTPWVAGPLTIDTAKQNDLLKQIRFQALEKLEPYKAQLKHRGFNVTIHVLHGDARASLLRVSTYHAVDLVLVGKRNRNWKKGFSSAGTVSSYLVSHSTAPVLVIK
ncbi:adenine nucleotide alpha hydrolases-like protein [Testicularia cyperi]|uniref:Adenine nucleotide alpha hydrolases-like protein n=1 Tax=Testicularia cyperi TaxID=1882483 RepID=A0A317XY28_9BASI|nr:adenine nucleotide alpha hydrolases-like protein [Testicularia cyperi]